MKRILLIVPLSIFNLLLTIFLLQPLTSQPLTQTKGVIVYYISPEGDDNNDGSQAFPLQTIQEGADRGRTDKRNGFDVTLIVEPGIYREKVEFMNGQTDDDPQTSLTIRSVNNNPAEVIISGADLWDTGWQQTEDIYSHTWPYDWGTMENPWPTWNPPIVITDVVRRREMVVLNDNPLSQVMKGSDCPTQMITGTFCVDETADSLYVWPNPGEVITQAEVGIRDKILRIYNTHNVTVTGLTFQHAASYFYHGNDADGRSRSSAAIALRGQNDAKATNITFENNIIRLNNSNGLGISNIQGLTIRYNQLTRNGINGYGGSRNTNLLIEENEISFNNWRGWPHEYRGFDVGNKLFTTRYGLIRGNDVHHNYSRGMWFDTDNQYVRIEDNLFRYNYMRALYIEANGGPIVIRNNYFEANGAAPNPSGLPYMDDDGGEALYISASWDGLLEHNLFVNNYRSQVHFGSQAGRDVTDYETGLVHYVEPISWTFRNNIFLGNMVDTSFIHVHLDKSQANLQSDYNQFCHTVEDNGFTPYAVSSQRARPFGVWQINQQDYHSTFILAPTCTTLFNLTLKSQLTTTQLIDLNMACHPAPVNTTTTCTFNLPPQTILPTNFQLQIGAGLVASCIQLDSAVTCTDVSTGNASGLQPIFFYQANQPGPTASGDTVNIYGNALLINQIIPNTGLVSGGETITLTGENMGPPRYTLPVTLTNPGPSRNNWPVLIEVDTQTPIVAGEMQPDCADIRWQETPGGQPLSFWLESGCNTTQTLFWVQIPTVPSGDTTLSMVYGEASTISMSNLTAVFPIFGLASHEVWLKGNQGIINPTPNGEVPVWLSQTTARTGGYLNDTYLPPTYKTNGINRLPVLHFDDSQGGQALKFVNVRRTLNFTENTQTVFVVMAHTEADLMGRNASYLLGRSQGSWLNVGLPTDRVTVRSYPEPELISAEGTLPPNQANLISIAAFTSGTKVYINSQNVISESTLAFHFWFNDNSSNDSLKLGTVSTTTVPAMPYHGDVAEVIIFRQALSATAQVAVETYLCLKYALPCNLGELPQVTVGVAYGTWPQVTIGNSQCNQLNWLSNFQVTCLTPPQAVGTYDVTLTNPQGDIITYTAGFTYYEIVSPTYMLNLTIVGSGTVTVSPNQPSYLVGSVVTLTAIAASGAFFSSWSGDANTADNPLIITMMSTQTITATFSQQPSISHTLTVNIVGSGSVSPGGGSYLSGTLISLTASPSITWDFAGWRGEVSGSENPVGLLMDAPKVVTATFNVINPGYRVYLPLLIK